jgi:hypothetical protein
MSYGYVHASATYVVSPLPLGEAAPPALRGVGGV